MNRTQARLIRRALEIALNTGTPGCYYDGRSTAEQKVIEHALSAISQEPAAWADAADDVQEFLKEVGE